MTEETKDQKQTAQEKPHRKQPVVIYMIILMAVVVVMLLFSYGMQARSSQQLENLTNTVEGLEDSYTALERINEMQGNIDTLNSQVNDLEDELEDAAEALEEKQAELDKLTQEAEANALQHDALNYLFALGKAYEENDFPLCQSILKAMEGTESLIDALPASTKLGEITTFSPRDIYTAIAEDVAAVANAGAEEGAAPAGEGAEKTDNMGSPEG